MLTAIGSFGDFHDKSSGAHIAKGDGC